MNNNDLEIELQDKKENQPNTNKFNEFGQQGKEFLKNKVITHTNDFFIYIWAFWRGYNKKKIGSAYIVLRLVPTSTPNCEPDQQGADHQQSEPNKGRG